MKFEDAYQKFIQSHLKRRRGPGRERLKRSHTYGHAEFQFCQNVWWPAFHHFNHLHPEYEVHDFQDGFRYIDFAYIQPHFRVAIEIDGIESHWRNTTQWKFSDHCARQNHLVIDGWKVLRFAYYDVQERPRLCQQTVQQLMGRLVVDASAFVQQLSLIEREIIRLAMQSTHPITPAQVATQTHMSSETATRHLRQLSARSWLQPASGKVRIRSYQLHPSRTDIWI